MRSSVAELIASMAYRFIPLVIGVAVQIFILLDPTFARANETLDKFTMNDYFAHFEWQKSNNMEIASSLPQQNFSYKTIGTLEFAKPGVEGDFIPHLAKISGLSAMQVKESKDPIKVFIVKDSSIMTILNNNPDRLYKVGIPDQIVTSLRNMDAGMICKGVGHVNNDQDIEITFILSADKSDKCLYNIIYNAFGIINPNNGPPAELSLCILYEARWRGKRTREEIASVFDDVKKACETRLPGA
ncbi:hypothetical protein SAMN05519104_0230 [Rhizobiales bacterium GAS188]|nr:hypothetical protein SAMN05519104_0230 [Rhizobiales bacterium GAS188]